jgi:hypothetical protein
MSRTSFGSSSDRRCSLALTRARTPRSTAVGSIWRSPNSASYHLSAWIAASPTSKPSSTKSPPGSRSEIPITPRPTGTSQSRRLASNSASARFDLTESSD